MTTPAHQAAARIREALESPTRPSFDFPIEVNPADLRPLLAEREELAKDAARLRGALQGMVRQFGYDVVHPKGLVHDEHEAIRASLAALTNKD